MIKIGDVFEIPFRAQEKAFGQYLIRDEKQGPIIQVFDLIQEDPLSDIEYLNTRKLLFPPIITGLFAAIRTGLWHIIGKLPIQKIAYPKFVSAYYDHITGEAYRWFVWDGGKYIHVGNPLPKEYKKHEYLIVWNPYDVMHRIETGEYLFPYKDLIQKNKFVPK
jgi:hypothetical protein